MNASQQAVKKIHETAHILRKQLDSMLRCHGSKQYAISETEISQGEKSDWLLFVWDALEFLEEIEVSESDGLYTTMTY